MRDLCCRLSLNFPLLLLKSVSNPSFRPNPSSTTWAWRRSDFRAGPRRRRPRKVWAQSDTPSSLCSSLDRVMNRTMTFFSGNSLKCWEFQSSDLRALLLSVFKLLCLFPKRAQLPCSVGPPTVPSSYSNTLYCSPQSWFLRTSQLYQPGSRHTPSCLFTNGSRWPLLAQRARTSLSQRTALNS